MCLRGERNNECKVSHLGDKFISKHVKSTLNDNNACERTQMLDILKVCLHDNQNYTFQYINQTKN